LELELRDSAVQARMIYDSLLRRGVSRRQLSIWAWGASRPISNTNRDDSVNRGVTIEIFRSQTDGED
jgi:outer membrane protein OmpA-like peptidoglycan-associated protein